MKEEKTDIANSNTKTKPIKEKNESKPQKDGKEVYCYNCGKVIRENSKFCSYCGAQISEK